MTTTAVVKLMHPEEGFAGLVADAKDLLLRAKSIEVTDDASYEKAGLYARAVKRDQKRMVAILDPYRAEAHELYKRNLARIKAIKDPTDAALGVMRTKLADYNAKIERQRREATIAAQQKAEEEAIADERARKQLDAASEPVAGGEEATVPPPLPFVSAPVQGPPQIVEQPKAAGISHRTTWKGRLVGADDTDREAALRNLCAAIGNYEAPVNLVRFNQSAADQMARVMKASLRIPGLEAYSVDSTSIVG